MTVSLFMLEIGSSESRDAKELYSNLAWKDGKIKQLEKQLDILKTQMEESQVEHDRQLKEKQQIIETKVNTLGNELYLFMCVCGTNSIIFRKCN